MLRIPFIALFIGVSSLQAQTETMGDEERAMIENMDSIRLEMGKLYDELDSIWRAFELENGYVNCAEGLYSVDESKGLPDDNVVTTYSKACLWKIVKISLCTDGTFEYWIDDRNGRISYAVGTWSTANDNTIVLVSNESASKDVVDQKNGPESMAYVYHPLLGELFLLEEAGLRDYSLRR